MAKTRDNVWARIGYGRRSLSNLTTVHKHLNHDMIDHFHPNFPPSLSITPNVGHVTNNAGDNWDAFGIEAQ